MFILALRRQQLGRRVRPASSRRRTTSTPRRPSWPASAGIGGG